MFSIDAKVNVVLTSITTSVSTGTGAEVWTKVGDYVGFETNKTAWKKVGGKRGNAKSLYYTFCFYIIFQYPSLLKLYFVFLIFFLCTLLLLINNSLKIHQHCWYEIY